MTNTQACAVCGADSATLTTEKTQLNGLPVGVWACASCRRAVRDRQAGVCRNADGSLHITDGRQLADDVGAETAPASIPSLDESSGDVSHTLSFAGTGSLNVPAQEPLVHTPHNDYTAFLASKQRTWHGVSIPEISLPEALFAFQAAVDRWALRKGRCAIWADTGLGKTAMQLAWADQLRRQDHAVLILAPLAVGAQSAEEAVKFGVPAAVCRSQAEVQPGVITIANYEMLHAFDPSAFSGIVLDESGILKAFSGSTKQRLIDAFRDTPYRLCCTATPAPNDYLELGNHAEFLGVMPSNEMIMRWFTNDPMQAGRYTLKAHGAKDFWRWVSSWALSLTKPSDIGFDDDGFVLPALTVTPVSVGHLDIPPADGRLFVEPDVSATALHATLRASAPARAAKAAALMAAEPNEQWLVWVNTDYDADALLALVPDILEVHGTDTPDEKAAGLLGFANGNVRRLMTKPSVAGFGMNFQRCARQIVMGLSFSYEQFYQSIRRSWRFGQTRAVRVFVLLAENERTVLSTLKEKEARHNELKAEMIAASRDAVSAELSPPAPLVHRKTLEDGGERWRLINGDCIEALRTQPDESIDYTVFSPPFSNLYVYSDAIADMGNAANDDEFFAHFTFLIHELYRVTVPGRLVSVHCKDLPRYQGAHGSAGLFDFAGRTIQAFEEAGWRYHSRVTIWKDPVIEMQRTNNHGLLYKQLRADSCASRQGMADYVVTFRKWGEIRKLREFPKPVEHTREDFPLEQWQRWASPVWDDIVQTRVLQYQHAKDDEDERHICPLQLDVIERCIQLWSNPGDLVLSPFTGIGSEGFEALRLGRRFLGMELKPSYWRVAARNLRQAAALQTQGSLFAEVSA